MTGRSVLVTGGAGFIGANFTICWSTAYTQDRIVVLDALNYAANVHNLDSLQGRENFRFVHGDIRDTDAVTRLLREESIDTIVHFAAESHVDRSILGPDAFVQANVVGTTSMLDASRTAWHGKEIDQPIRRFHHVSTDEVYGSLGRDDPAFTETTAYDPSSPYAASKAASDHFVRAYHRTYGLPVTISNCSNNYGPYQFPEKLIPLVIINALSGQALPVYGDGTNVRDWLFVTDHCRAIDLVLRHGVVGETYNIGGNAEYRNIDLVKALCALLDDVIAADGVMRERFPHCPAACGDSCAELITYVSDRPGHDWRYAINAEKVRRVTGFLPMESLQTGLRKTVNWYLNNEAWWRPLLNEQLETWWRLNYGAAGRT